MKGRRARFEKVPARFVIAGVVILFGVLSTAYGYYNAVQGALYVGIGVTVLGAVDTVFLMILQPAAHRSFGRFRR